MRGILYMIPTRTLEEKKKYLAQLPRDHSSVIYSVEAFAISRLRYVFTRWKNVRQSALFSSYYLCYYILGDIRIH